MGVKLDSEKNAVFRIDIREILGGFQVAIWLHVIGAELLLRASSENNVLSKHDVTEWKLRLVGNKKGAQSNLQSNLENKYLSRISIFRLQRVFWMVIQGQVARIYFSAGFPCKAIVAQDTHKKEPNRAAKRLFGIPMCIKILAERTGVFGFFIAQLSRVSHIPQVTQLYLPFAKHQNEKCQFFPVSRI